MLLEMTVAAEESVRKRVLRDEMKVQAGKCWYMPKQAEVGYGGIAVFSSCISSHEEVCRQGQTLANISG